MRRHPLLNEIMADIFSADLSDMDIDVMSEERRLLVKAALALRLDLAAQGARFDSDPVLLQFRDRRPDETVH